MLIQYNEYCTLNRKEIELVLIITAIDLMKLARIPVNEFMARIDRHTMDRSMVSNLTSKLHCSIT